MPPRYHTLLPALLLLALAAPADLRAQQLVPVDQAVGDLDPLARSQRTIQVGLRSTGEQTALFELRPDPAGRTTPGPLIDAPVYYRVGPGFRARVDRLDYLVVTPEQTLGLNSAPRRDGEFYELIPANTVFDLRPSPLAPLPVASAAPLDARAAKAAAAADPRSIQTPRPNAPRALPPEDLAARYRVEPRRIERQIDNRLIPRRATDWPAHPADPAQAPAPARRAAAQAAPASSASVAPATQPSPGPTAGRPSP